MHLTVKISLLIVFLHFNLFAQKLELKGVVQDGNGKSIQGVLISAFPDSVSSLSGKQGEFRIRLSEGKKQVKFQHISFRDTTILVQSPFPGIMKMILIWKITILEGVEVSERRQELSGDISITRLDPKSLEAMPSGIGDFNKLLSTLPGVTSNNEFSSTYSVRGGNYDENLIYVNGIKIYRPFLISAGRQEGLSFINPDMVGAIHFSAGGWQARYGDKLSSMLAVQYKEPKSFSARANLSLLGGSLYAGGTNKSKDFTYSVGIRHKNTQYLLGSLKTQGQYLPNFTDIQAFVTQRLSDKTKIGFIAASAFNRYLTIPETSQTEFGTIQASFRLTVAFDGREKLDYNTHQAGVMLSHNFSNSWTSHLTVSGVSSIERENYEVEGGYLLCDVNNNPASSRFNECAVIRGIGTNYRYGRNKLDAKILSISQRNEIDLNGISAEFGFNWDYENFDDQLKEYAFVDSADHSMVTRSVANNVDITSSKISGFGQITIPNADSTLTANLGIRLNYWTFSEQLLVSPRLQFAYRPNWLRPTVFRLATGLYRQHPFYRELRDRDGAIQPEVKAQSSFHIVGGIDRHFLAWGRPFKFSTDVYYKNMWDVNPYDIDNVRIRYFATNQADAYAYGVDFRVNGEFIEGTESWFSLGLLETKEDLNEGNGNVRRPADQHINLGIFFQDHMPNDPSLKVSMTMLFGSGLPFGPPGVDALRNRFSGDEYYRVDLGLSKSFSFINNQSFIPNSLWIGLEVLNLLGADNTISYTWIEDVVGNQFAVPNALSARFFNVRVVADF